MKKYTAYIDGQYYRVPLSVLESFAPGRFSADGVFETMLAHGSKVFDLRPHLERLRKGFPTAKVTSRVVQRVVEENGFAVARARVLAFRQKGQTCVVVMALKHRPAPARPFRVCLVKTNRPASARRAGIKSLDYALFADAYALARSKGFDEALLLNSKGEIFEASRANLFWVKAGVLCTPPLSSGCLNGITRQTVVRLAQRLGVPIKERTLTPRDWPKVEAAFVTNSLLGAKPLLVTPSLPLLL